MGVSAPRLRRAVGWLRGRHAGRAEAGSAVVEFIGVSLLLLIPTVYLIVTLSRIEAASFAAEGAAREAGRVIATADTMADGVEAAEVAIELAFADQGLQVDPAQALLVSCESTPCLSPGEYIHIEVASSVPLPLMPDFLAAAIPAQVGVQAEAMTAVGGYRDQP